MFFFFSCNCHKILYIDFKDHSDCDQKEEKQKLIGFFTALLLTSLRKKIIIANSSGTDGNEYQNKAWQEVYELSQKCQNIWKGLSTVDDDCLEEYLRHLLIYELDSCLHMQQWNQVKPIIQKIIKRNIQTSDQVKSNRRDSKSENNFPPSLLLQCAADLLLNCNNFPLDKLLDSLKLMTNEKLLNGISGSLTSYDQQEEIETAAKWIRVLVGLTLPAREEVCVDVLAHLKEFLKGKGKVSRNC